MALKPDITAIVDKNIGNSHLLLTQLIFFEKRVER